ncbi:MAG: DUF1080 domain-containing protein [Kiritimatiellia bacterium]|jgi:hypothetical protein|nr:DUF1080 domain-containing protein [Kiritimatiellia bacterium]
MKSITIAMLVVAVAVSSTCLAADEWVSLFDGKTMDGWKASEHSDSWKVEDGKLVCFGPRSHLFYVGDVKGANFKNFELKLEVLLHPGSNSGVYIHTAYQQNGWPNKGYEAQVNNTHKDRKKTGGLYGVKDVMDKSPAKDNEWWSYHITVKGKRIILKVNGEVTADYTEPEDLNRPNRQLSSGTIALQAHDPKSKAEYKNIKIKPLP